MVKMVLIYFLDAKLVERVIPGNALAVDDEKPFYALNKFGNAFLSKFEASVVCILLIS